MDFQKLLLDIGKALKRDEVKASAFLCIDLLSRNPNSVESASDLFSRLVDQDHLSPEKPHLLKELLLTLQRTRLLRDLGLDTLPTRSLISPYRKLLYNLSEEITNDELREVKFLLNKQLPRRKLEDNVTTLEVFLEMEHLDLISDTNLNTLETIFQSVCPMLNGKISEFKAQQVSNTNLIAQEISRPRSSSFPSLPKQGSQSLPRTGSCEVQAFPPLSLSSVNSSNTSVDLPHGAEERDTVEFKLRILSIETGSGASSQVKNHTLEYSSSPEKTTSSGKPTPQTANTQTEGLETYPMISAKRGICLIINNYDFTKSRGVLKNRKGTMVDEKCLQEVFEWLGFDVETHRDRGGMEILSLLSDLSRRDHSQMDCLVCCVLSHGKEGGVFGVDGHVVTLDELTSPFNGSNCPSLVEKPKLFFIQACQGNSRQGAVFIESDSRADGLIHSDAISMRESIPTGADVLLGMATVPFFVSYREPKTGTWFIKSLCQNLVQMVPREYDLVSIMTKVNADVSQKADVLDGTVIKQMPQPAFSLRKKVVFPVPKTSPPIL